MYKLLIWFFIFLFSFSLSFAELWDSSIKDSLIWISDSNVTWDYVEDDNWFFQLSLLLWWIKNWLTNIIILIAVWVFLFIGSRLAIARWNPEEFKKAMMQMVYAIVWIFIVSIAWALVALVAGINL